MICSNNIETVISSISDSQDNSLFTSSKNTSSSGNTSSENEVKKIALTFDDGPHLKYTLKLLDGLKARNVKATFFIIGENASNYPEIVKRISDDGHLIGNHTYTHVQLTCISETEAISEIKNTNDIIYDCTGKIPRFIRPPYGLYSDKLKKETNLTPVLWSVDPRDWSILNTNSVVKHVLKRVKHGDIILLHDIFDTSVDAALKIINNLLAQGYEFVTVDEFF